MASVEVIDINEECKNEYYIECTRNLVESVDSKSYSCFLENVIKIENFSSLKKLFRFTWYVLRFLENLLTKLQSDKKKIIKGVNSFDEVSEAKYLWLSSGQKEVLKFPKFSQLKKSLCFFRDENCLLLLKRQLGNAECSEDFKHPIYIPNDTYLTKLMIRDCHVQVLHGGLNFTSNYLTKDCVVCKKAQAWPLRGHRIYQVIVYQMIMLLAILV